MSRSDALDDGRPTAADDRAWRAAVRRQDRLYAQAYDAGVAGAAWEPDAWPDDPMVWEAYDTGVVERRRRRRARRWALTAAALRWTGRHLAPRTARRVRRAGGRWRRLRRTAARSFRATLAAVALGLLAAASTAAGCAGGDNDARHQYPSFDEADPEAVANVRETLAMSDPGAASVPDELAWTLVVETCVQLDDGEDPGELVLFMADEGFTGELAAAVLVAAAFDVCPHHRQTVEEWST